MLHIPGVRWEEKARWIEITFEHAYPNVDSWLEEGASWPGGDRGTILPTCLKAIKRQRPPPAPAGIGKCDYSTIQRWRADDFRFPPYQYREDFLVWRNEKWRVTSASERELLHGLGYEHTTLCWSASHIKQDPRMCERAWWVMVLTALPLLTSPLWPV